MSEFTKRLEVLRAYDKERADHAEKIILASVRKNVTATDWRHMLAEIGGEIDLRPQKVTIDSEIATVVLGLDEDEDEIMPPNNSFVSVEGSTLATCVTIGGSIVLLVAEDRIVLARGSGMERTIIYDGPIE